MDFSRLQNLNFDNSAANSTLTSLPSTIMDALIPGYGAFSQIIFRLFGIDIGLVVSGCLVIFGLIQGSQFVYSRAYSYFQSYFTSTVLVDNQDQMYGTVMDWLTEQNMTKASRDVKLSTKWVSSYNDGDDNSAADDDDAVNDNGIFNFEKWISNVPLRYEPSYGSNKLYHEGRYFMFSRERREGKRNPWSSNGDDEFLLIQCIGRSTQPIKDLLTHTKYWTLEKEKKMTSVFRPPPQTDGCETGDWNRTSCRPSRPMSTVSLDPEQKAKIVMDINEYLQPATARWYAARGIPYRRGYLFHGNPGTGKTSLSFALAGIFRLEVYCISLNEVGLTESHLGKLFSTLPRRCIVLLEDIDSAGLRRDDMSDDSGSDEGSDGDSEPDTFRKDSSKPHKKAGGKSLISLAGLLNIIDGAASHEGRVLIMTTNCPESLDPALIRPGRVDLQVAFTLATHEQIADIFTRMYSIELDMKDDSDKITSTKTASKVTAAVSKKSTATSKQDAKFLELLARPPTPDTVNSEELAELAQQFADQLPEDKFSPAEIQGFLLVKKREPRKAVEEVAKWRDEVLEARKKGKKVITVK